MLLTAPPAWHPASSLLGRALRRGVADERQAESLYIVAVALVAVGMALLEQWGWMRWEAAPLAYGLGLGAVWLLAGATCLAGWRPRLHVRVLAGRLEIRRGDEELVLVCAQVESAERVSAAVYHRHWRSYAATRAFVNRLGEEVLLLRTAYGPVVLGLPAADLARLETHLAARIGLRTADRLVRAA